MLQQLAEVTDARGGQCFDRTGRDGVHTNILRAQRNGHITRRGFQAGLGHAHQVVVRHHALGTQVGECKQRRVVTLQQHRAGGFGQRGVAIGGYVMRNARGFAGNAIEEVAFQGFGRGESDRMDQTIQAFPFLAQCHEQVVDIGIDAHIAGENQFAAEFIGKLGDAFLKTLVLEGKGQRGPFTMAGLGNAIGDRMF